MTRPTQVLYCSTLFSAMTLAAAIDAGRLGPDDVRRVVVTSDNGPTPEIGPSLARSPGFTVLRDRVDEVASWNAFIAPLHPAAWEPTEDEQPMLARALQAYLRLDGPPAELVVESIAVAPARTLVTLLRDCPITVFSDGLMSYGPTRSRLPVELGTRVTRVLHLDLVPGLRPVLLHEEGVSTDALPDDVFRKVLAEAASLPPFANTLGTLSSGGALVLGQYLAALDIMTSGEESERYASMVRAAARAGHDRVLFKPHPAAGRDQVRVVRAAAQGAGIELTVVPAELPAELCFADLRPDLVVGCFSTALFTARSLYGLPIATMGAAHVLDALSPYQNSNRIPATIVDALVPRLAENGTLTEPDVIEIDALVRAVSFCMQPGSLADVRPVAERWIAEHGTQRYFRRRRLQAVGLLPSATGPRSRLARSRVAQWDVARQGLQQARALQARLDRARGARRR